ncbi:hypothetical protein HNQ72_004368 [Rhizobium wenxiniae]|uniref:Uncharacterized protein n=1 Tax=Rhizobium wenxiniae TaxID=1737357 RepID=A0A7W9YB47_9HYPH|nr:hypothetical protein [Rhizobium wenxiniae]
METSFAVGCLLQQPFSDIFRPARRAVTDGRNAHGPSARRDPRVRFPRTTWRPREPFPTTGSWRGYTPADRASTSYDADRIPPLFQLRCRLVHRTRVCCSAAAPAQLSAGSWLREKADQFMPRRIWRISKSAIAVCPAGRPVKTSNEADPMRLEKNLCPRGWRQWA